MAHAFRIACKACSAEVLTGFSPFCKQCGGMTDVYYDLSGARLRESENPFERYFDILPVKDQSLLPADSVSTPCVHALELGRRLGLNRLYLKDETANPTGTTKYRMAAVSLPFLYESGVTHFCTSSTGNSSTAYAVAIRNIPELKMSLFTGSDFRHRVNYEDTPQIDHYILNGASFAEAFEYGGVFANAHGFTSERGFFNIGRREGLKVTWIEAVEQVPTTIDWYVQAVSSAMGVVGVYKGAQECVALGLSSRTPRLLCAQQASCSPMVTAWRENAEQIEPHHIVEEPHGIAMAILRGNPSKAYPFVRAIVDESNGDMRAVSEADIREARRLVFELEGIDICFSAATAVAATIQRAEAGLFDADETVLINLTGSDRPNGAVPERVINLERSGDGWEPT